MQDECSDEFDACLDNTTCAACFDGAVADTECTANPTTCSATAAFNCCKVEATAGCSTNALLVAAMSEWKHSKKGDAIALG